MRRLHAPRIAHGLLFRRVPIAGYITQRPRRLHTVRQLGLGPGLEEVRARIRVRVKVKVRVRD